MVRRFRPRIAADDDELMRRAAGFVRGLGEGDEHDRIMRQLGDLYAVAAEDIVEQGIRGARNPIAVMFNRIKRAREVEDIDRFIEEWDLLRDTALIDTLRNLPKESHKTALASLEGARDAYQVMMSRLRKLGVTVKSAKAMRIEERQKRDGGDRGGGDDRRRDSRDRRGNSPPKENARGRDTDRRDNRQRSVSQDSEISLASMDKEEHWAAIDEFVEGCIDDNGAERVGEIMRSLSHSAAKAVMRQDMGSAHNKTAVAVSRCNKAAEKHDRPSFFARIDGFCRRHHLNDEFIDQLRQLGRTAADAVMNKKRWKAPCENTVQDAINEARGDNEFIPKERRVQDVLARHPVPEDYARLLHLLDTRALERVTSWLREHSSVEEVMQIIDRYIKNVEIVRETPSEVVGMFISDDSLRIQKILPGSPANRAGVKKYWRIVAINDHPIQTKLEAAEMVGSTSGSFTVSFVTTI